MKQIYRVSQHRDQSKTSQISPSRLHQYTPRYLREVDFCHTPPDRVYLTFSIKPMLQYDLECNPYGKYEYKTECPHQYSEFLINKSDMSCFLFTSFTFPTIFISFFFNATPTLLKAVWDSFQIIFISLALFFTVISYLLPAALVSASSFPLHSLFHFTHPFS